MSRRARAVLLGGSLLLGIAALLLLQVVHGPARRFSYDEAWRGILGALGLGSPLPDEAAQITARLRLWRALTAAGVGASLAGAGALLQGLFRNPLADPSLIGVTAGASFGATLAILALGGQVPLLLLADAQHVPYLLELAAFAGALLVAMLVVGLSQRGGRLSVPDLLLVGVALNACLSGAMVALQSFALDEWEVSRAILTWTFGTLDDRSGRQVLLALAGAAAVLAVAPFVALELDLLAGGDEDAAALGVPIGRTRGLVLAAAAFGTAAAVGAAGQIVFVGLVVPHLLRLLAGHSHRRLLWLAPAGGALFLLGVDLAQSLALGTRKLQPSVLMSLLGGPFFLLLLVRHRRELRSW
jgi:iron complex transport system permease protein